jgi:uncharacterized phage-associated protein
MIGLAVANPRSTVAAVGNEFLKLATAETQFSLDQMKLQKLIFYAHAWSLAFDKGPLFENDFEAWAWGPVVRDVYVQTRAYGRGSITSRLTELKVIEGDGVTVSSPDGVASAELSGFIKSVWDALKTYTGVQLSNSTHGPGEPWTIVNDALGTDGKPVIPNDLIKSVFKRKLNDPTANPAS